MSPVKFWFNGSIWPIWQKGLNSAKIAWSIHISTWLLAGWRRTAPSLNYNWFENAPACTHFLHNEFYSPFPKLTLICDVTWHHDIVVKFRPFLSSFFNLVTGALLGPSNGSTMRALNDRQTCGTDSTISTADMEGSNASYSLQLWPSVNVCSWSIRTRKVTLSSLSKCSSLIAEAIPRNIVQLF